MNDVTARLTSPRSLSSGQRPTAPPSRLDLGGASRRTARRSLSEARVRERSDLDGPAVRRHHHSSPGGRARPARALGSKFGRFGRTSLARQAGERPVDVDHMRTTSNPNSHGSVTSDLHISRQRTRATPDGPTTKAIATRRASQVPSGGSRRPAAPLHGKGQSSQDRARAWNWAKARAERFARGRCCTKHAHPGVCADAP